MLTIHSEATKKRDAATELYGGKLVAPFECPSRVDMVLGQVKKVGLGDVEEPKSYGLDPVFDVHDRTYVAFLENCWDDWVAAGFEGEAIASVWPTRTMRGDLVPTHIDGKIGYYALAAETAITAGTFEAAQVSKDIALCALDHVTRNGQPAFGLCRPPGHHAAVDQFGGYCFFNNAAIAAQRALNDGMKKVAVLDVDFHHGNGTQHIFYDRDDVLFISLHGDPREAFPYFLGYADETGSGKGEGYNVNYPMPSGTGYEQWSLALDDAIDRIRRYRPELLIVSLGVDTFEKDPISFFKLKSEDFLDYGGRLKTLELPTVVLLEGGYAVEEIGVNAVNVLQGLEGG